MVHWKDVISLLFPPYLAADELFLTLNYDSFLGRSHASSLLGADDQHVGRLLLDPVEDIC